METVVFHTPPPPVAAQEQRQAMAVPVANFWWGVSYLADDL